MQKVFGRVVVLGTGGTIAGIAGDAADSVGYKAAQLTVGELLAVLPAARAFEVEAEQVAQVDSKDMTFEVWRLLAERVRHHLDRLEVMGVVITHGTDTLEETAYFLQRLLAPSKPVVITAAMRPATSMLADGPQNLADALDVVRAPGARGVLAVVAGQVHSGSDVRKVHPYRLDAFSSGDAGPVAQIEEGVVRRHRGWPAGVPVTIGAWPANAEQWPWIEIVTSHAGARDDVVRLLCAAGVDGLVVAATGNGTLHRSLEAALQAAQASGVAVLRCTRCLDGRLIDPPEVVGADGVAQLPSAGSLTPVQARVELLLQRLARR